MRRPSPRVARNRRRVTLYLPLFLLAAAFWLSLPSGVINSGHALAAVALLASVGMFILDQPKGSER